MDNNIIQENVHVMPRTNESFIHGLHTRGSKFLFCSLNWRYIWNTTILLRGGRLLWKLSRSRTCRTNHCKGKAQSSSGHGTVTFLPDSQMLCYEEIKQGPFPDTTTDWGWGGAIHVESLLIKTFGMQPFLPSVIHQHNIIIKYWCCMCVVLNTLLQNQYNLLCA